MCAKRRTYRARFKFVICSHSPVAPRRNANTTIQCPVEKGTHKVVQSVTLPKEIPPGTFVSQTFVNVDSCMLLTAQFAVNARGYTADDEDLFCLDLMMDFRMRPGSFIPW